MSGNQTGQYVIPQKLQVSKNLFECNFEAIPFDIDYRPFRKTPIPKITGIMSAKLESGAGDEYAFIDDHGRYKAKMLFDISDKNNGEATLPIRLTQSYSGAGYGIHFPNHEGTELLWSCVDGNVDRPIGLGTIPNPSNASPSTSGNKSQSVIRTAGQNELTFDDKTGSENIYLHGTKDWTIDITNDKNQKIGHDETASVGNNRSREVGNNESIKIGNNLTINVGKDESLTIGSNNTRKVGSNEAISVSGNRDKKVDGNQSETIGADKTIKVSGNHTETISANMTQNISSTKSEKIDGAKTVEVGKDSSEKIGGSKSMDAGKIFQKVQEIIFQKVQAKILPWMPVKK